MHAQQLDNHGRVSYHHLFLFLFPFPSPSLLSNLSFSHKAGKSCLVAAACGNRTVIMILQEWLGTHAMSSVVQHDEIVYSCSYTCRCPLPMQVLMNSMHKLNKHMKTFVHRRVMSLFISQVSIRYPKILEFVTSINASPN